MGRALCRGPGRMRQATRDLVSSGLRVWASSRAWALAGISSTACAWPRTCIT
jgi:hypothetical protein